MKKLLLTLTYPIRTIWYKSYRKRISKKWKGDI